MVFFEDFKFLDFQVLRSPNSQISRILDFETLPAAPPPDELSDPNLTPLPTHPRIKYAARALAAPNKLNCQQKKVPKHKR